ncbi:MAG: energy-coupling factor transporter transmembrane protein EcfT [Spirochaetaceae bacterium]|jgi:energy-coupling factor transporter transmembrane protein EcfT|nr:energy-coupling factor transporter transmembrane protein EcfT [Spirochaetaceae bacterium]
MKNLIKVFLLAAYAVGVFFVSSFWAIGALALFNLCVMAFARLPPKSALIYLRGVAPFIILAGLINLIIGPWQEGVLVVARLAIVCNMTQSFRHAVNSMQLANAIETFCRPLKIFRVEPRDAGLMVCICVAFIPVLTREFDQIKRGLEAKGMTIKPRTVKYILKPFLYGIFKRTDEISNALLAKAYC